jgi:RNA polymerase sigma factor (sigma-70 family)
MEYTKTLTDDQLVEMYAQGNNEAFDALLDRYKSKLYSYIYLTVRDEDLANDLFQETFVKVIMRIQEGRYQASGKFQAWITRIAHNLIMDSYRLRAGENAMSNDGDGPDLLNDVSLADESYEQQLVYSQTLEDVKKLCQMLPQSQSEVVYMRFYSNMSFKEIADKLDISINTALGRMRYALLNMRRLACENHISLSLH